MLILKCRAGEAVHCNDLSIVVRSIEGNNVRLGFVAPQTTKIWRHTLLKDSPDIAAMLTEQQIKFCELIDAKGGT